MKYKSLALAVLLAGFAASALAQTPISGSSKCGKPDSSQTIDVGDQPGHVLVIEKGSCTWTTPFEMAGLKATTYTVADTVDVNGPKGQARGYAVITMDNSDKAYVRYTGTGITSKEGNLTGDGTWAYTGGTGKLKGLKGKGTYKTTGTPDGNSEAKVEGEYSLPEPGAAKKK